MVPVINRHTTILKYPPKYIVYCTTHRPSGRYYIGAHVATEKNKGYLGSGRGITAMLRAHPRSEFDLRVIAQLQSKEEMYALEAMIVQPFLIDKEHFPNVLNINPGGRGGAGRKATDCTRQKLRIAGEEISNETRQKRVASMQGHEVTQITRGRISAALQGFKVLDETKAKISATLKQRQPQIDVCPHCGRSGIHRNMLRWHFDKCKFRSA